MKKAMITTIQLLIIVSGPIVELFPTLDPLFSVRAVICACKFLISDCSALEIPKGNYKHFKMFHR